MARLALIHPTGLLAQELRQSLDRRKELWLTMRLLSDAEDEIGQLTEVRGAAAMVQALEASTLEGLDVAFFAGTMESTVPWLERLGNGTRVILLGPDIRPEHGQPLVAGVNLADLDPTAVLLSPPPAAIALAHLLHPLRAFDPQRLSATLLQPISVRGTEALEEVLDQTRAILTFTQNPPKEIFQTQLTFNVLPTEGLEPGVTAHLHAVLGYELPVELQVLQASTFHSFAISAFVELGKDPGTKAVRKALTAHAFIDPSPDPELLGPIDAAARDELVLGTVEPAGRPGVYRIWAVMDNLTCGGALNALHIFEALGTHITH
jgi:aspartate-semialdehyde dehydrogenase